MMRLKFRRAFCTKRSKHIMPWNNQYTVGPAEFSDFALKNSFRRNSFIGDQFRRNSLLNVCKSQKMSADFGGIACNFGGITRTQLWLQISTAHENPISAEILNSAIPVLKCNFGRSSQEGFPIEVSLSYLGGPLCSQFSISKFESRKSISVHWYQIIF